MRRPSLTSALVLALVGIVAGACTTGSKPEPRPVPASGVVTIPSLLRGAGVQDVDVGTDGLDSALRFSLWDGELVVIGVDRPPAERFLVTVQPSGTYVRSAVGCGQEPAVVPVGQDELVVGGLTADPDALAAVGRELTVTDGTIDTSRLDPARGEVGRLPADWLLGGGGSRFTVGLERYLVRRVDPAEQRLLVALLCPDPGHRMAPPPSTPSSALDGYGPARHHVSGRTVDTGATGQAQLAVVRGTTGLLVAQAFHCCGLPGPRRLVRLTAEVRSLPEAEVRRLDVATQTTTQGALSARLRKELAGEHAVAVADGRVGDQRWTLARRDQRYLQGAVPPEVCWSAVTAIDDAPEYDYMTECLLDEPARDPVVPAPTSTSPLVDHVWGQVGADVVKVVVERAGAPSIDATIEDRWFVAALDPPTPTEGYVQGDLLRRTYVLKGGPVVLRAFDAQGKQLAAVAIGKAGCPVPPGCPA